MPRMGIKSSTRRIKGRSLRSRYLFSTGSASLHGRQIDVCHVGPLVSQQTGHGEMGVQRRHAAVDERCVLFSGVGMPQSMESNAPVRRSGVADGVTVTEDELLHTVDGPVGGNAIRHQQLVTVLRFLQQPLQHHGNTVILDGNDTHLTALAFYSEGVFAQRTLRRGGVHAEALMDAQTGIAGQIQGEDVVLPLLRHGAADQLTELRVRPCAILLPEAAALQRNTQCFIARQHVAGMGHLIVEKADGREVGLDGAGGLALLLQIEDVSHQMLKDYPDVMSIEQMCEILSISTKTGYRILREGKILHKALKYAVKIDLIDVNPADKVERPKKDRYVGSFYDADEVNALFEAAKGSKLELPILFGAFYGLRRSEAIGLKWDAIDFDQNTITIRHTVTSCDLDGKRILVAADTTKTKSSMRTLPLVPFMRERLLALKEEQQENRRLCGRSYIKDYLEYVCVNEIGDLIKPHYVTESFPKLLKANGLRHIRYHDLRHPYVKHTTKKYSLCKSRNPKLPSLLIVWGFCFLYLIL